MKRTKRSDVFLQRPMIPKGTEGDHSIEHIRLPAGTPLETANIRTSMFGSHRRSEVRYDRATRWHKLKYSGGTWMTDLPIEYAQAQQLLRGVQRGSVLVGGLGLGLAAFMLACRPKIRAVTVVELSSEVISLVKPHVMRALGRFARKVDVVHADLLAFLKDRKENPTPRLQWDHAYYDIWQSDGESTLYSVVCPLLKLSHGVVRRRPICWNEDVMRGQVAMGLVSNATLGNQIPGRLDALAVPVPEGQGSDWHNRTVPFYKWVKDTNPSHDRIEAGAVLWAQTFGTALWPLSWTAFTESHECTINEGGK